MLNKLSSSPAGGSPGLQSHQALRMRTSRFRAWAGTLILLLVAGARGSSLAAEEAPAPSPAAVRFFETEVRPLFVSRCQKCHGPRQQRGGLRLDSRQAILEGGENGP